MDEPIVELISYADHTQGCMVGAGHDECTCGYDDAEGKAQAAWDALKAENARLAIDISEITKAAEVWLRRRNEIASQRDRLAAALRVARERLLDWAAYASADRTRLAQDLAAIDAALSPQEQVK